MQKNMKKLKIPKPDLPNQNNRKFITENETFRNPLSLRLDFTYLDTKFECFSAWQQQQLKKLSNFIRMHRDQEQYRISFSGEGCSKEFKTHLETYANRISEDLLDNIRAEHLYVGKKERLHGFKCNNIFYIIRLDCSHKVN
jgi:hypothetical protein